MLRKRTSDSCCLWALVALVVSTGCETALAGPEAELPMSAAPLPERRLGFACVATQETGTTIRSRKLNDARLKALFGDQLGKTALGDTLHPVLLVHHFRIGSAGGTSSFLTCVLPSRSPLLDRIASIVAAGQGEAWGTLRQDVAAGPAMTHERGRMGLAAGLLREITAPNARYSGRVTSGRQGYPTGLPTFTPPEGYIPSTEERPPQVLPEVEVTASQTQWTIDFNFLWQTVRGHKSFSELINWEYFLSSPICPPAEALWQAKNAEADSMQVEAENVGGLEAATENAAGCVPIANYPLCIDFFIMNTRVALFGYGDGRTFADTGKHASSRVVVFINPQTGAKQVHWSSSVATGPISIGPWPYVGWGIWYKDDSAAVFNINEHIKVDSANGWLRVTAHLVNNFCANWWTCVVPPIDASILLEPSASQPSGYKVWWKRDAFPSMAVKMRKADNSGWHVLAEDPEASSSKYTAWRALIEGVRQSVSLPPGCYET